MTMLFIHYQKNILSKWINYKNKVIKNNILIKQLNFIYLRQIINKNHILSWVILKNQYQKDKVVLNLNLYN